MVTTGILTIPGILPLTGSIIYLSCENITTLVAELTLRRSVYRWTTRPLTGGYVLRRYRGRKSLTGISSSVSSASAWSTSSRAHTHSYTLQRITSIHNVACNKHDSSQPETIHERHSTRLATKSIPTQGVSRKPANMVTTDQTRH